MENKNIEYVETGRWTSAEWKLAITDVIPDEERVTAVFGIPFHPDGLVMTKNHRGWELPGGHREIGETIKETLAREILEESGIKYFTSSTNPVAHLEIIDDTPKMNKATGENYPNPSYILFYAVRTEHSLEQHSDDETLDCGIFSLDNLPEIESKNLMINLKYLIPAAQQAKDFK